MYCTNEQRWLYKKESIKLAPHNTLRKRIETQSLISQSLTLYHKNLQNNIRRHSIVMSLKGVCARIYRPYI